MVRLEEIVRVIHPPSRPENVHRLGKYVVVHQPSVNAEHSHHQYDVSAVEEDVGYFVLPGFEGPFRRDEEDAEEGEYDGVAEVAEHHGEEEGERYDREEGRVDFSVTGHTVRVDQVLEAPGELVGAVVGRRWQAVVVYRVHEGSRVRLENII